jgi:hypothetical protein
MVEAEDVPELVDERRADGIAAIPEARDKVDAIGVHDELAGHERLAFTVPDGDGERDSPIGCGERDVGRRWRGPSDEHRSPTPASPLRLDEWASTLGTLLGAADEDEFEPARVGEHAQRDEEILLR